MTIEQQPAVTRKNTWLKIVIPIIIIAIIAGIAIWYYLLNPYCGVNRVNTGIEEMTNILVKWDGNTTIANQTPRMSLSGPIQNMNENRQALNDLELPGCLETARQDLLDSFDYTIKGFLNFASNESDNLIQANFASATTNMKWYIEGIIKITECAPFCEQE